MSFSAMFYKKVFVFITLQFAFISLFTGTVKAEGEDYMKEIPQKQLESIAKELKLPVDSRHIKDLFSPHGDSTPLEEKYPQQIIKHIKGNSGERFATEEEVYLSIAEYGTKMESIISNREKELSADRLTKSQQKNNFNKKELLDLAASLNRDMPICSKSTTEKVRSETENTDPSDKLLFDFIVVNPNTPLPDDLGKAFGNNIIVVVRTDGEDIISQILHDKNVMCLPARIRATENVTFIDQGLNALKNYDQNFYGQGVLDKKVLNIMKIQ